MPYLRRARPAAGARSLSRRWRRSSTRHSAPGASPTAPERRQRRPTDCLRDRRPADVCRRDDGVDRFSDAEPSDAIATPLRVLSSRQRIAHAVLAALWLVVSVRFWAFWLDDAHRGSLALYVPATVALAYLNTVLPTFFWFYVGRMRRPLHVPPKAGTRVALVTLCVPSHESLAVIERQLRALVEVRYPHDSWVLDEGGDPEIERLADTLGVSYFTRKGKPLWNQPGPPFQAKTKAGNVNAWLDHIAKTDQDYPFFVQLDIDHRPRPEYLDRALGHFGDPRVAWVQAPSVCRNLDSWTARGQAEQDLVLQGPLQMGFYGHSRTPFIIGSHTTYRTAAVREIGGFQPTRAEDHLDTVVLAAAGYTGVYVPEIIASGDGPEDLGTYLAQQFAWAYSMVQIFIRHTPRLVRRYTPRQAFQFLMAQSWYLLWSMSMAVLWVLPLVALLVDRPIATVPLSAFLGYHLCLLAMSSAMWCWCRDWFQPTGVRLSWRALVLEIARWPIVLWAVINVLLRIKRPYMITPKGRTMRHPHPGLPLYGPYFALVGVGIGAVVAFHAAAGQEAAQGYLALVMFNVAMFTAFLLTAVGLEVHELRTRSDGLGAAVRTRLGVVVALGASCAATAAAVALASTPMLEAIS
jgi:cellulose synthase (UDP-forming)